MSDERRRILDLLAAGKINATEAERLLEAVGSKSGEGAAATPAGAKPQPKYLMIQVDQVEGDSQHYGKVNVRVPLQVLKAGVKLAALIPASAKNKVNEALHEQGIDFNIDNIRPQDLEELVTALSELTVDVNNRDGKVHIYCE